MREGCRTCSSALRSRSRPPTTRPGSAAGSSPAEPRRFSRSHEPAFPETESARGEPAQAPAVSVADRAGERVRRIRGRVAGELEQALDHMLHLLLARVTVADHRLLHLQRGVFGHGQPRVDRGADRGTARLAEGERGGGIGVDEDFLDRDLLRAVLLDHLAQVREYRSKSLGQARVARLDAAARDVGDGRAVLLDDSEPGDAQTRIDAKYPQRGAGHPRIMPY